MDTEKMNGNKNEEAMQEIVMARTSLDLENDDKFLENFPTDSDRVVGQGFYRLAKVFYDKSDLKKAESNFLKALEKSIFPKDVFTIFKIYGFLIRVYSEAQKVSLAKQYILKSEELLETLSTELGSLNGEYFYNAGSVSNYKGDFEEAYKNFQFAYQKAQQENEPELTAKSLYSIANACFHSKKFDEALNCLGQLNELLAILKKDYLKGSMHILYGNIYRETGEFSKADSHYDKAINVLQDKTCWNLYCYILLGKGIILKKSGEFNKALIFFDLALNSIDQNNFRRLADLIKAEVEDVNDSSVDLYLDRHNRIIHEKSLGTIDFKHRFVLLEILFLLAKNSGSYFNKDDLAREIWKDEYNPLIHDKLIYTSISRLRKLIEPKGGARKYILRGKDGYTFNPRTNARFHKENDSSMIKGIGNVEISSPV